MDSHEISQLMMQNDSAFAMQAMNAEMWGQDTGGLEGRPGQDFAASASSAVTGMGVPAAGFGMMMGSWAMQSKLGWDPFIGGMMAGGRAGIRAATGMGLGTLGRGVMGAGLGAVGMAAGMLPGMAVEAGLSYVGDQIFQGANQQFGTERFMQQMGQISDPFGSQSVMGGGFGFGAGVGGGGASWVTNTGASSMEDIGKSTGLGFEGAMGMAGSMASSGMLGSFSDPNDFMQKFREKLKQVEKVAGALDTSLTEAAAVMSKLQGLGLSSAGQESMGIRLGTVSAMTGLSADNVMGVGAVGAQQAVQLGLGPEAGFELGVSNLASITTMNNLGALNENLVRRSGGAQGLAETLTNISLQMPQTRGGYDMLRRLVDDEGTGMDMERLTDETAGGRRRGRRGIDPYAMEGLMADFQENEAGIILGRVGQIQARYGQDSESANRHQYRFMAEMGIEDPQMQQAYLQNLRAQPVMNVIEAAQQIQDDQSGSAERRNDARNVFSRFFAKLGDDLDEAIGEPLRGLGRNMAETFGRLGDDISQWAGGREAAGTPQMRMTSQVINRYTDRILGGDNTGSYTRNETLDLLTDSTLIQNQADDRGFFGRILGEDDRRDSARMQNLTAQGWMSGSTLGSHSATIVDTLVQDEKVPITGLAGLAVGPVNAPRGWMVEAFTNPSSSESRQSRRDAAGYQLLRMTGIGGLLNVEDPTSPEAQGVSAEDYYRFRNAEAGIYLDENMDRATADEYSVSRFQSNLESPQYRTQVMALLNGTDARGAQAVMAQRLGMTVEGGELSASQRATMQQAYQALDTTASQRRQWGVVEGGAASEHEVRAAILGEDISARFSLMINDENVSHSSVNSFIESDRGRSALRSAELAGVARRATGRERSVFDEEAFSAPTALLAALEEVPEAGGVNEGTGVRRRPGANYTSAQIDEALGGLGWRERYADTILTEEDVANAFEEQGGASIDRTSRDGVRQQHNANRSRNLDRYTAANFTRIGIENRDRSVEFMYTRAAVDATDRFQRGTTEEMQGVINRVQSALGEDASPELTAEALMYAGFSHLDPAQLELLTSQTGGGAIVESMRDIQNQYADPSMAGRSAEERWSQTTTRMIREAADFAETSLTGGAEGLRRITRQDGDGVGFIERVEAWESTSISAARAREFRNRAEGMRETMATEIGPELLDTAGQLRYHSLIDSGSSPGQAMETVATEGARDNTFFLEGTEALRSAFVALSGENTGLVIGEPDIQSVLASREAAIVRTGDRAAIKAWQTTGRAEAEANLQRRRGGEVGLEEGWAQVGRSLVEGGFSQQEIRGVGILMGAEAAAPVQAIMRGSERTDESGRNQITAALTSVWGEAGLLGLAEELGINVSGETAEQRRQNAGEAIARSLQGTDASGADSDQQRHTRQGVMSRIMASGVLGGDELANQQQRQDARTAQQATIQMRDILADVAAGRSAFATRERTVAEIADEAANMSGSTL